MFLKNISVKQFKSHSSAEFELQKGINCLTGKNGTGKTNILDAIYCLLNGKSYFQTADSLCVLQDQTWYLLKGNLSHPDNDLPILVSFQLGKRKSIKVDEEPITKLATFFGKFPCVVIAPDDVLIVHGESEQRRRYFDYMLSMVDREYLLNLTAYNKALELRNKQLKLFLENDQFDAVLLQFYDEQLARHGQFLYEARKSVTFEFDTYFHQAYSDISSGNEVPFFKYISKLHEQTFEKGFSQTLGKDRILGRTSFGTHRDDWQFELNGLQLKKTGSQGQIKTFLISLKLAMYRYIQSKRGIKPLLLLDDIFEKIDHERMLKLVHIITSGELGQVIITDTSQKRIEEYFANKENVKFFELKS